MRQSRNSVSFLETIIDDGTHRIVVIKGAVLKCVTGKNGYGPAFSPWLF